MGVWTLGDRATHLLQPRRYFPTFMTNRQRGKLGPLAYPRRKLGIDNFKSALFNTEEPFPTGPWNVNNENSVDT